MLYSNKHRLITLLLGGLLWASVAAFGQELEISVSPSPVGAGARAAGMADAFVAIADDATAASWNPAGLVQLERPELSLVGAGNLVYEEFFAIGHEEVDSRHHEDAFDLNYLSVAYPLPLLLWGRNAVLSLNYQQKYDFSRRFKVDYLTASAYSNGMPISYTQHLDFEQEGGLSTLSPAFAIELTHRLSIGAAVNFWRSSFLKDNSWKQHLRYDSFGFSYLQTSFGVTEYEEEYEDFSGENFTLGLLWNPSNRWTFGLRYDTAFTGEVKYKKEGYSISGLLPSSTSLGNMNTGVFLTKEQRYVRFPDSLALGLAYRANDRLTLSLDVTRTDWNDFYVKDKEGRRFSLVDFSALDNPWTRSQFDPTYTVRLGGEYVFVPKEPEEQLGRLWSLRAGLFYDEEPASGRKSGFTWPGDNGDGNPESFYGVTWGVGLLLGQRVNLDFAYQLRYGQDVNADFLRGVNGFREDFFQHRFLLSTVIYF